MPKNEHRSQKLIVALVIITSVGVSLIALPDILRARKTASSTKILEDLRLIDAAIDRYAIEQNKLAAPNVT